jgi:hypothetical protein
VSLVTNYAPHHREEWRYGSTHSLMSAGIRRMVSFTSRSCYSQRKNPVPIGYEVGWAPKLVYVLWRWEKPRKLVYTNCVPTQLKSRSRIYDAECGFCRRTVWCEPKGTHGRFLTHHVRCRNSQSSCRSTPNRCSWQNAVKQGNKQKALIRRICLR